MLASKLVNELVEAADDKQLSKTIARYGRVDQLLLDELGYTELDRRGAELLFQVLTRTRGEVRHRDRLPRAVLRQDQDLHRPRPLRRHRDRLTFNGQIIETGTTSYRLAHARRVKATN